MSTYAIGDIQGCFNALQKLLQLINFNENDDTLWLTGDLVNRGPDSLKVVRFIKNLKSNAISVLGNHDLHLIAVAFGAQPLAKSDTFQNILYAEDKADLINWLRFRPILHEDRKIGFVMTHAGIAPLWDLSQAKQYAKELEHHLQQKNPLPLLNHLYGNEPSLWNEQLTGFERLRCITNYFTRMRYCDKNGQLNLSFKGQVKDAPSTLYPWFILPKRKKISEKIIFGHWASLQGQTFLPDIFALDSGCVWGQFLTALRLEDQQRFQVNCAS